MQLPTIHLNGTSAVTLLEDLSKALAALHRTQKAIAETAPNARDYTMQPTSSFHAAQDEHYSRMQRLRDVSVELNQIAEHVAREHERTRRPSLADSLKACTGATEVTVTEERG